MKGKISQFFEYAADFIGGRDDDGIHWSTVDDFLGCYREVAEAENDESEDSITEVTLRSLRAFVHSREDEDRLLGIAMLEDLAINSDSHLGRLQERQRLYLLSVGYYRSGDYPMCMDFVDKCLKISPNWEEALSLKKTIKERDTKDYWTGVGITAAAVGAGGIVAAGTGVVGGIAAAAVRRGLIIAAGGIVAATSAVVVQKRAAASAEKN